MSDAKRTAPEAVPERRTGIDADETVYHVVVNLEEQYSIWPAYRGQPPAGWRSVGVTGDKSSCLDHINQVWTDMRPLSLRLRMAELAALPESDSHAAEAESREAEPEIESVVSLLSRGEHPVEASLRPERNATALKEALERGYVHLKFTDTRGGTELGMHLDLARSRFDRADFVQGFGSIHLEGTLELDGVDVRCFADLDLARLSGSGGLKRADASVPL
jgi:uncharacterized protein YbdZ (MbtH family)